MIDKKIEILQFPPQRRTVFVREIDYHWGDRNEAFFLRFPHTIFLKGIGYPYLYFGFLTHPITNLESQIYFPWFPNIYNSFRVCLKPGDKGIKKAIDKFWNTGFNYEKHCEDDWKGPQELELAFDSSSALENYEAWEEAPYHKVMETMSLGHFRTLEYVENRIIKRMEKYDRRKKAK
jgi:hypothetical protein